MLKCSRKSHIKALSSIDAILITFNNEQLLLFFKQILKYNINLGPIYLSDSAFIAYL